ncbi:MAG: radical SAM protein [Dehalococcoidia bacterium]
MKIALIAPPYPLSEAPSPPLGISYVAATCIEAGAEVAVLDYIVSQYTPEKLHHDLDSFNPDIVGTNSVTMNFLTSISIIQEAKRHNPELITMMGGPHVSFDIEDTLHQYPELDLIVAGEGEETLKELIPLIKDRKAWPGITGIAFRDGEEIIITPSRPLIEDLDNLPLPARHLLPLSRYAALGFPVSIITSRGCPNRCIFCLGRKMVGYKVRHRSPASVAEEIEHLLAYGVDRINVADDIFTASKKRVRALCEEIIRRDLHFGWSAFSRVNTVDREILTIMRQAGCDGISFGIESGNPEMLKRVKKGITLEQARNAVQYCKDVGIEPHASFIVGLPGENHQTLRDTENFAEELEIEYGHHMLAPFPGTTVREEIDGYDLEILTDNWDLYDANQAIVRTSALSAEEMNKFLADFEKRRIDRWEGVKQRCREGNCTPDEALHVEGVDRMNLIYKFLSEDVICKAGSFSVDGHDPVTELASRVTPLTDHNYDSVHRTLGALAEKGYLAFEHTENHVRWFWTHNNRVDHFAHNSSASH